MSDAGIPIEKIARLVGHTRTTTTETVYRKQIRPVVMGGTEVMDNLFPRGAPMLSYAVSYSATKGHDFRCVVMASAVPLARRITGSGRGGSGQSAVAALLPPVRCPFLVCVMTTCPRSPGVLSQRRKPATWPSGQAIRVPLSYRVIRTRVPSGIPESRRNAAAGTRTQPLLTAWPNTDGLGQPCRPTVPGPPPKEESALE
jgi:hypothetical protein